MKGTKLLFIALLAPLILRAGLADDTTDTSRAATRRGTTTTISSNRQKPTTTQPSGTSSAPNATASRTVNTQKTGSMVRERNAATNTRSNNSNNDKRLSARTTTNNVVSRTSQSDSNRVTARSDLQNRSGAQTRGAITSRTATGTHTPSAIGNRTLGGTISSRGRMATNTSSRARSATTTNTVLTAADITSRDYKKCREVFNSCMDEFCANKDAQLKRCACSSRLHEFDGMRERMENIEDKLLDFNQRLLTISMDAEDAAALNQATAGELAFNQKDRSESQKMLDEIAKKLNTSFDNNNFDQNLNSISLSLNMDAAFDSVDSLSGAASTSKSGTALYSAALPVCREMAAEVCTPDELSIAEGGYMVLVEQDCNTVQKSYQNQTDQARSKVFESSALLDMSRLSTYQDRNSDDILTCKQKMLDMLTDTTVCGTDLSSCLDITGRYIDPTTGQAFLTTTLANLSTLITRPSGDAKWSTMAHNDKFVQYLNSKKKFLEPAMEKCENISSYVWDSFIEDALSQIKIAQDKKLEDIRRSCTTLTTQCMSDTLKSISEFDSRALSIFGVIADKTVNEMCSDIKTACTALMQSTGGGDDEWVGGMDNIASDKTYDTILSTCREVGRNCIIQVCSSISGNFGLCENIDTSINRKSIMNRTACWDQVHECIANAGDDALKTIWDNNWKSSNINDFFAKLYSNVEMDKYSAPDNIQTTNGDATTTFIPYNWCASECDNWFSIDCIKCQLTAEIWGHCEGRPDTNLENSSRHNKIILMDKNDEDATLLSWFAYNTGTEERDDNCRDTTCGIGFRELNGECVDSAGFTNDGIYCRNIGKEITLPNNTTNCCTTKNIDSWGNCCDTGTQPITIAAATTGYLDNTNTVKTTICVPYVPKKYEYTHAKIVAASDSQMLLCIGQSSDESQTSLNDDNLISCDEKCNERQELFPYVDTIVCNGLFLVTPRAGSNNQPYKMLNSDYIKIQYYPENDDTHSNPKPISETPTSGQWFIQYDITQ